MTQTALMPCYFYARTGNSETLKERSINQNPNWVYPIVSSINYLLDMFVNINVNAAQTTRYLDYSEQRVMKNALYRSARLLHKA